MTVDEHFSPYDGSFLALWDSSDFVSGDIPGGTYVIEVCANDGTVLKYQDKIDGSFLDISTIKSPSPGETGVGATPTIRWTKVSRARYYRIWLLDENWNSIYDYKRLLEVIGTSVKLPKGNLKPGKTYHMRIEARNDYQDIDKRSRTSWIVFTTANW